MQIEFLFEDISELMTAYAKFEETVQIVQILIADCSRSFIEFLHCFRVRFFRQFRHLLLSKLTQHHVLLSFRQLPDRKEE